MSTMTQAQADRIHERTAALVSGWRVDADTLEAAGNLDDAETLRMLADSRERAGMRAHAGAHIGRA